MNEKPNYAYLHGYLSSSLSAESILMRMKFNHGYDPGSDKKQEELLEALDLVCKDILQEANEGSKNKVTMEMA